jgi:hypothetical protein
MEIIVNSDNNLIAIMGSQFLYPIIYFSHPSYIYFKRILICNTILSIRSKYFNLLIHNMCGRGRTEKEKGPPP